MKKNKLFIIFSIFSLAILLFSFKSSLAQTNSSNGYTAPTNIDSNDAIAVRIIPNPEHLSIARWYEGRGFSGAPQALTVDGYEAIRDGRTVYVNAANVKGKEIFTNIYLISYNQNPSIKTIDILGQIVKNWKFNTDLKESVSPAPSCRISVTPCDKDADCPTNQYCLLNDSSHDIVTLNKTCRLKEEKYCLTDSDCPQNFYCNSVKAKIIRDIKRINQTEEIKNALYSYKQEKGYYPKLESGSYIAGQAVSVWPSWNSTFLSELSLKQIADPINHLGACPNFDSTTCWNKDTKRFYSSANGSLILPAGSFSFIYKTTNKGLGYDLCATMETRVPTADLSFTFSPNTVVSSDCILATGIASNGSVVNTAPRFVSSYLFGDTEQEFSGPIVVVDDQNNPLTWTMTSSVNWTQAGWGSVPVLKASSNINQKKVYSTKAGKPGVYPINITVNDGQGGIFSTTTNITISNPKAYIEADNLEYTLNPSTPFSYTFYVSNPNLNNYLSDITVTKVSGPSSFDLLSLMKSTSPVSSGRYRTTYSGTIPTTSKFSGNTEFVYRISVQDKFGGKTTKDFKITIKNEGISLNFNCSGASRVGSAYSCLLGQVEQLSQKISYLYNSIPFAGLRILTVGTGVFLDSPKTTIDSDHATSTVVIKAVNPYGASTTKEFNLAVNTYCGDGIKQNPNTEGKGGIYNDGQEDCDGTQGVALTAASSSEMAQYACATFNGDTPNPITNNNYCVFKSPVAGGGFCGDTYCQVKQENKDNCPEDCLSVCVPNCSRLGHDCGDNGCGGTCGDCAIGDECYGGKCCLNEGTFDVTSGASSFSVYLNGTKITAFNTNAPGVFDGKILHGKNVLAIQATDSTMRSISAKIKQISQVLDKDKNPKNTCRDYSTANLNNWKCRNYIGNDGSVIASSEWFKPTYNDSNWSAPNSGNGYPYNTIWAKDFNSSLAQETTAYCRYTFNGDDVDTTACTAPLAATKECGSNGCGGNYRPNNCVATHKGTYQANWMCNDAAGKCECPSRDTCEARNTASGVSAGQLGSACGQFPDKCNGTTDCGAACDTGLYCKLPATYESANYLGYANRGSDYNFISRACNAGKPDNTCQKKCWITTVTTSVDIKQGDVPESKNCAVKEYRDDPKCSDYNPPTCPTDCDDSQILINDGISGDSCYTSGFLGIKSWTKRKEWRCSATPVSTTRYFGDTCSSSGSKIDNNGDCTCSPSCSNVGSLVNCGSNGCGGLCNDGKCNAGSKCVSGACAACTPNCTGKECGASDGCGGRCSSGSCPAQNMNCVGDGTGGYTCSCTPSCGDAINGYAACGADDGCGGSCWGSNMKCSGGKVCSGGNGCIDSCTPNCTDAACGSSDGCGGKCMDGFCPHTGSFCTNGKCVTCGSCTGSTACSAFTTQLSCTNHYCNWMFCAAN